MTTVVDNLEREQTFVDNTTWYGTELKGVAIGDDMSMTRWWLDFRNTQYARRLAFTQLAVQRWRDGKICDDRFYYSPQPVIDGWSRWPASGERALSGSSHFVRGPGLRSHLGMPHTINADQLEALAEPMRGVRSRCPARFGQSAVSGRA